MLAVFFEEYWLVSQCDLGFFNFSGIHKVKMSMGAKNFNLNRSQPYDPILPVAREISSEASLLCFDEFQVII